MSNRRKHPQADRFAGYEPAAIRDVAPEDLSGNASRKISGVVDTRAATRALSLIREKIIIPLFLSWDALRTLLNAGCGGPGALNDLYIISCEDSEGLFAPCTPIHPLGLAGCQRHPNPVYWKSNHVISGIGTPGAPASVSCRCPV